MRQSGAEALVPEEPYACMAHVRVCGGAGWVTTGSTRKCAMKRDLGMDEGGNSVVPWGCTGTP